MNRFRVISAVLLFVLFLFALSGCFEGRTVRVQPTVSDGGTGDRNEGGTTIETVDPPVAPESLTFPAGSVVLTVGECAVVRAVVLPENAADKTVTYVSADETVFLYENGVVRAVGEGTAALKAQTANGRLTARCMIVVEAPAQTTETPTVSTKTPTVTTETPTASTETPTVTTETPDVSTETPTVPTETPTVTTETPTVSTETPGMTTVLSEKRVSFLAAGDNIIHEAVFTDAMTLAAAQAAENGYSEKYYFDSMYDSVRSVIEAADIAYVNHECPVAGEEYGISGYPTFNSPIEAVKALERVGFDVVNVANNHMLDMDDDCPGYRNTVNNLKACTSMTVIGGYTKTDYDELRILEKNGVKIAFLSYTVFTNNEKVNASSPEMIVPYPAPDDVRRQTAKAKANADFVVVSIHWGDENSFEVNDSQRELADLSCSCGVDVVIGMHSHTIQPVTTIENNGQSTLCYWSLGNFLSTQHPIRNLTGIFAQMDFVIDGEGNKRVENAAAIPHLTWYSASRADLHVYLFEDVTKDLIASHGSQLRLAENGGTFTLADVRAFIKKQLGDFAQDL